MRTSKLSLFLGQFAGLCLLQLLCPGNALESQDTAAPVLTQLLVTLIEVILDGLDQLVQCDAVVALNVGQGDAGAGLATHQLSQATLALDNAIWDSHLTAQGRQEEHQLKAQEIGLVQSIIPSKYIKKVNF